MKVHCQNLENLGVMFKGIRPSAIDLTNGSWKRITYVLPGLVSRVERDVDLALMTHYLKQNT
jgi:hypothetical protein